MPEQPVTPPSSPLSMLATALAKLSELPPEITDLADRFTSAGHELALVGGPVRDAMLGRACSDLDFATSAHPDETERILLDWVGHKAASSGNKPSSGQKATEPDQKPAAKPGPLWTMGREFGTIGAYKRLATPHPEFGDAVIVEITTYRSDQYDPASRKPVVQFGDTLAGDLSRRDFTVNAMAVRLPDLTFVDPFDGLVDLAGGLLRTPIEPDRSFDDDPLRMLRACRFAAQLGFDVEPATLAAIARLAPRIEIVSAERIQAELTKLILGQYPRAGLTLLVDSHLADYVLPELPALQLEVDEHHRHKDVYQHSLTVLDQAIAQETGPDGAVPAPDLVLRLAALLHDIGKPATRRFLPGGGVSFHGHDHVGARLAAKRLKALRFEKQVVSDVARLVELHMRFHGYGEAAWTDSAVRRYVTDAGPLLERLHRLTRADCTTRNKRQAQWLRAAYDDLVERIAELRAQEELDAIRPDLDGTEIMAILGIPPGKDVGKAYKHLLALRMEHGPLGRERAEAELKTWWTDRSG